MAQNTDILDLGRIGLTSGEGRHLDLSLRMDDLSLGGQSYAAVPGTVPVRLDVSRMTGGGYALRLRYEVQLSGPCMRCLEDANPVFEVEAREVSQPGEGEELESPYLERGMLDLHAWARDALALALPTTLLCRSDCAGLCTVCGADMNASGSEHHHDRAPDSRWAPLSELRFE